MTKVGARHFNWFLVNFGKGNDFHFGHLLENDLIWNRRTIFLSMAIPRLNSNANKDIGQALT